MKDVRDVPGYQPKGLIGRITGWSEFAEKKVKEYQDFIQADSPFQKLYSLLTFLAESFNLSTIPVFSEVIFLTSSSACSKASRPFLIKSSCRQKLKEQSDKIKSEQLSFS